MDYVLAWAPFLKAWSLLGDAAQTDVSNLALRTQQAVGNGNLTGATALWAEVEGTISNLTDNVVWAPLPLLLFCMQPSAYGWLQEWLPDGYGHRG